MATKGYVNQDESGAASTVASDAIFDAKGDLPVGTGANTAAKLTAGADGLVLTTDSSTATGLKWAAGGVGGTPTDITVADTTDASCYVALFESATGDLEPKTDAGLTYNASTGVLTATGFSGPLTGNVTGNASTVTTNANLTGDVTSVGNATTIGAGKVTEAMQVLADNTTNDFSTTKHGYVPKGTNVGNFLKDDGTWAAVSGSGLTSPQVLARSMGA